MIGPATVFERVERGGSPKLAVVSQTVGWLPRLNPRDCHRYLVESYDETFRADVIRRPLKLLFQKAGRCS